MTPTNELRFVERIADYRSGELTFEKTVRILQQKWEEVRNFDVNWITPPAYEWRDVEVVKEPKQ